ncbi:MAG: 23S rRNA (guanosine(2251)-2'-O)-methyltransferase RlmB, partial [Acholeplasmatales bacterium]|nr:23S rRNA (guanosine(2251)-2'-O)-methyltransferase RlmB [Acholeplasmatales bacterium]
IQDPHNLGAILRSVDAFGFDLVILPKNRSCFVNETVAHVSTGAIEYTKIMYVNSLPTAVNKLKDLGFWICGTDAKGTTLASQIDKSLKLAVIIGSEGFGMSKTLVNASDFLITIPMVGHVNSLNASVSCAIVLHELSK